MNYDSISQFIKEINFLCRLIQNLVINEGSY